MPVELGYFTLKVKDMEKAKAFYGAAFGWEFEEGSSHVANTKFPLGLAEGGPGEFRFVYFRVDDLEAGMKKITDAGGYILERHTYPSGPNAICSDDQGTSFALWQPAPGYE
jgi:predicted enzyme related to lactoylglutathione lyase